jgi:hypothetical protein
MLWRLLRRKGASSPPYFLRDLVLGDLGAALNRQKRIKP